MTRQQKLQVAQIQSCSCISPTNTFSGSTQSRLETAHLFAPGCPKCSDSPVPLIAAITEASGWLGSFTQSSRILSSLVVQWSAMWPHTKKSSLCTVCMSSTFVRLQAQCSNCLPPSKDKHVKSIGDSKLPVGVSISVCGCWSH